MRTETVGSADIDGPCRLAHGDVIAFNGVECYFEDPAASVADEQPTTVLQISPVDTGPGLSPCQQQVLERIADGATNREIGELLGISERTVKAYASELYGKLDVSNRAGAVAQGVKHGLL